MASNLREGNNNNNIENEFVYWRPFTQVTV